ncbi:MAG: glycosyltransferase family 9 protein [Bryobacteraceae bacterium]|nr:glycosyltransferase family 9 protein [Bryobacteraceae bacterium]
MKRLLIRPGAIGDVIVSLPALEAFAGESAEIWVPHALVPLIRFGSRVRAISATGLDLLEVAGSPGVLAGLGRFDEILSWYGGNREQFRAAVSGLPFRFFDALPRDPREHATDFYLRQAGLPAGATPRIPITAAAAGFIAIHPFSGSARKNWPLERYRELAAALPGEVRFTAGPEETLAEAHRFADLGSLAGWLASASLYIGNDSGITHLAAALGVPTIAIFQASDPEVWAPRGRRVAVIRPPEADVRRVLAAAERMLAPPGLASR